MIASYGEDGSSCWSPSRWTEQFLGRVEAFAGDVEAFAGDVEAFAGDVFPQILTTDYMGVEPKIGVFYSPNHPFLIGFSIIFTIHLGYPPLFLETPIYCYSTWLL